MDPTLQKYYENRLYMATTPGWKDLMEDVQAMLDSTNKLDGVTPETIGFKQGEVSIMRWILSIAEVSAQTYEELKKNA